MFKGNTLARRHQENRAAWHSHAMPRTHRTSSGRKRAVCHENGASAFPLHRCTVGATLNQAPAESRLLMMNPTPDGLADWRIRIDALDEQLLDLLQRRVECALAVGAIKKAHGMPLFDPAREKRIYEKLRVRLRERGDDLPASAVTSIFREIISACRNAEHPVKVAYLGPAGTNTQEASLRHFGSAVEGFPCATPDEACRAVACGDADFATLAIENSIQGLVASNLDLLAHAHLSIVAEVELPIHHCLLSNGPLGQIHTVYSHDHALGQCKGWLAAHLPAAAIIPVTSTARGAQMAAQETGGAAICSALAADIYAVGIVARNIEDIPGNKTRFFVVGKPDKAPRPSGNDKTSLSFLTSHRPGALFDVLGVFAKHQVNILMIQSRPSRQQAWEYRFFADLQGHRHDAALSAALEELREHTTSVTVIGSYPEAGGG